MGESIERWPDRAEYKLTVGAHGVVDTSGDTESGEDTGEGLGALTGGSDGLARAVRTERDKVSCIPVRTDEYR